MLLNRVQNWFKKYEKYFFYYKDGFFVLPYLVNTPELMLESLKRMPFVTYDPNKNILYSNNPFTKGELHYQEIEEGLWLWVCEQEFRSNVHSRAVYDNKGSDYYFLAFSIYENKISSDLEMLINKQKVKNQNWAIYSPEIPIEAFHMKGTKGLFFNFAFNKKWAEENLLTTNMFSRILIQRILDSEVGYLSWDGLFPNSQLYANEIWKGLSKESFSKLKLKIQTLEMLTLFFETMGSDGEASQKYSHKAETNAMVNVERLLKENLTKGFPGIEFLAEQTNMSPSKLKSNFKTVYGNSIFQYYRKLQMNMALQMLNEQNVQIKNVAAFFGYENPSKFSVAFRKVHKILPSEVLKN